jgi:hypothetical protein
LFALHFFPALLLVSLSILFFFFFFCAFCQPPSSLALSLAHPFR